MTAIQPTAQFSVSVTADAVGPTGYVMLGGLFSGANISGSNPLYISDGIRTWEVTSTTGNSVKINENTLLCTVFGDSGAYVPPSWVVSDYSTLANATFSVYTGALVSNSTIGAQFIVDVGQFAQATLYDNGTNGDHTAGDGIWTGQFTTPNNNTVVTAANFYGICSIDGTVAVNQNFQSSQTASFDMELPAILTYSNSTTNSNYNGDLYLSSLCEGLSATNTADVQPTSAQAQFNFTVNKSNTTVDISIGGVGPWPMVTKQLQSFIFPNGATTLAGWCVWAGDDGNQNFTTDGIYPVNFYIHDINNLVGTTITTQIKVVSLKMSISNITMTPPAIGTTPAITNGIITSIGYTVMLSNDTGSFPKMNSSLQVLGWADAGKTTAYVPNTNSGISPISINGINSQGDAESSVWVMQTQGTLNAAGDFTAFTPGVDINDWDNYIAPLFLGFFQAQATVPLELLGNEVCETTTAQPTAVDYPAGSTVLTGDNNPGDDWWPKGFWPLETVNGNAPAGTWGFVSSTQPVTISQSIGLNWVGATPDQGNYRIDLQSQLTGLAYQNATPPNEVVPDKCNSAAGPVYYADECHFWPQYQVDTADGAWTGPLQGDQITAQNTSAVFVVNNTANPTSDNTPPQLLTSSPAENAAVAPNAYSASNDLSVQFQDISTAFNTGSSVSYITLTGPNGIVIGGSSLTNGGDPANGTLTISFQPTNPLVAGGSYTMNAFTCNTNGLCAQESIPFTIQDKTAPSINNVILTGQGGAQYTLSVLQSAAQGPYQNIEQIAVNIQMVNTANTIDYPDSSVSLYQISGTTQVPVAMTRLATTGTGSQGTLNYSINSVINSAGLYEVVTQTDSFDKSGNRYVGPAALANGTNSPEFTTEGCVTCVGILYSNYPNSNRPAILGQQPITVTSQGASVSLASISAVKPGSLPASSIYTFLATANNNNELQFYDNNVPLTTPLVWDYPALSPLTFQLYYDASDLAATTQTGATVIAAASLVVIGYSNGGWSVVNNASLPTSPTAINNVCSIPVPNNANSDVYYAIAYPSSLTNPAGTQTPGSQPTPLSFPSTRAFNPWNSNPIYQKARFYYSQVAPQTIEARVYDTSGRLIRDLTLGNGISATFTVDPYYQNSDYYFTWDGTNDAGTVVHNGIYLVRWNETGIDNSHNTQTRPVALIK